MVGGQASGIQSRCLRTETRNLEIQDGEDVDVLRRPGRVNILFHSEKGVRLLKGKNKTPLLCFKKDATVKMTTKNRKWFKFPISPIEIRLRFVTGIFWNIEIGSTIRRRCWLQSHFRWRIGFAVNDMLKNDLIIKFGARIKPIISGYFLTVFPWPSWICWIQQSSSKFLLRILLWFKNSLQFWSKICHLKV